MPNISNNNYSGLLQPGLSSLMTVGSNDTSLFHVGLTNGSKVRFGYATASAKLQLLNGAGGVGLCGILPNGEGSLDFMNLDLAALAVELKECRDAFYGTDYATANNGVLNQEIDNDILNTYAYDLAAEFGTSMQSLRWSGDTASGVAALAYHDGIIKLIQAAGVYVPILNATGYNQLPTVVITSGNVIDQIKDSINALPTSVTSHKGFKVVVGPTVSAALRSASMVAVGVNNLVMNPDLTTGRLTDNFFGYSVYEATGLGATTANSSIIVSGVFEDSTKGILKLGMNATNDEKSIEVMNLVESRYVRFTLASGQMVGLIPNLSQVAMNA